MSIPKDITQDNEMLAEVKIPKTTGINFIYLSKTHSLEHHGDIILQMTPLVSKEDNLIRAPSISCLWTNQIICPNATLVTNAANPTTFSLNVDILTELDVVIVVYMVIKREYVGIGTSNY